MDVTRINIYQKSTTFAIVAVVVFFFSFSCDRNPNPIIKPIQERSHTPGLEAENIVTIVSDSGIAKYRITTAEWKVFDKAESPYWEFPSGIFLESFDTNFEVEASIESDYAIFEEEKKLWTLKKNVKAINFSGRRFESEELCWNQDEERIYSDEFIKITEQDKIITGVGFESDQSLDQYVIKKPQGIFPIEENE